MGYIEKLDECKITFDWAVPQPWLDDIIKRAKAKVSPEIKYFLGWVWVYIPGGSPFGYPAPRNELARAILEELEEWYYDPYTNKMVQFVFGERQEIG